MNTNCAVLLVGHGTITSSADAPEFLRRIRRGRPASAELVTEIQRRYAHIGGSPLLGVTEALARAIEPRLGLPVQVAMRFWDPLIADVVAKLARDGVREVCVLPAAPFSVHVYADVVQEALRSLGDGAPPARPVAPYGSHPQLVRAHADVIAPLLQGRSPADTTLVLTAHSLPKHVLSTGDPYQREFEECARAVFDVLRYPGRVAYQSQGADGGDWLGPTLLDALGEAQRDGKRGVVVAPVGFLSDHVETLYDLDVEAAAQAAALGLIFDRVPALGDSAALADVMTLVVKEALK